MNKVWRSSAICFLLGVCAVFIAGRSGAQDLAQGKTFRDCPECPEMVVIPAGTFLMGSADTDTERDMAPVPHSVLGPLKWLIPTEEGVARQAMESEHPRHPVVIKNAFAIGRFPVTKGEFAAFVRGTGYQASSLCTLWRYHPYPNSYPVSWRRPGFAQEDQEPVVCLTWIDVTTFVAWLNKRSAERSNASVGEYRLPTEAEWEYAARAGTSTSRWWGDDIGTDNANCYGCGEWWAKTSRVDRYRPNPFGLYDMLGDISEWVEDCWHSNYVGAPGDGSAWTYSGCTTRVSRGGNWTNAPWQVRSTYRTYTEQAWALNYYGFRVAKTLR